MTTTPKTADQSCYEQRTELVRCAIRLTRSLFVAAAVTIAASEPLHAALVAYYPFNGNANDASGNGNNGTVHGAILTTDQYGNADSAYYFNGASYISANASTFPTGNRTVFLWFDAATVSNHPVFLGYGGGVCGTSFFMGLNAVPSEYNNSYYVSSHCDVNTLTHPYPSDPSGEWHNFAVTTDSSGTNLYVDGVLVASNTNYISNTTVAGTDLAIGVDVSPSGVAPYTDPNVGYFEGSIDDVRIYDTALSSQEIAQLAGIIPSVPEPASLLLLASGLIGLASLRHRRNG